MEQLRKHGELGRAALRSDMDRKTARKYVRLGKLPSELNQIRSWRTRPNPFTADWEWLSEQLSAAPELEAKTLFEALVERTPDRYEAGQLRTLQRHVRRWRAQHGPDQHVFFPQQHRPGEAMQTDFTWATELGVTIAGIALVHMLCHMVLPYSNWQWATVCFSESLLALKRGVQEALFRLGRRPEWHQTDNTTAATHWRVPGKRGFNDAYAEFIRHLGMKPRTIEVGAKEQNGDVEAAHRALKRRLEQRLLLRGSRDFESQAAYEQWIASVLDGANATRRERITEELAAMTVLVATRLAEFVELEVPVTAWSTIRVLHNTYSVPSRLRGHRVRVRAFDNELWVYHCDERQLVIERLRGRNNHRINYRHVIWSLVQKPGAFARYRYRDDLFPTAVFRGAYDAINEREPSIKGDVEYLRILHLAAATMEADVEAALQRLLAGGQVPSVDAVKALGVGSEPPEAPALDAYPVELGDYDTLLERGVES